MMKTETKLYKSSCIHLAKCGIRSYYFCRTTKGTLPECKGCTLVHHNERCKYIKEKNRLSTPKRCSVCGRILPPTQFYYRRVHVNGELRVYLSSMCKGCYKLRYYDKYERGNTDGEATTGKQEERATKGLQGR